MAMDVVKNEKKINTQGPMISIGIPTLRRFHYLKEAVDSCLVQTYSNIEIIISLDVVGEHASKDIIDYAQELIRKHPSKVRFLTATRNLGLAGNWNQIVDAARGEYIMIIGDDDRLLPDAISRYMEGYGHDIIFSNHHLIDKDGERLETYSTRNTILYKRSVLPAGVVTNPEAVIWSNSIPISACLIKSLLAKKIKFDEQLNTPEIDFFIRANYQRLSLFFLADYLTEYRIHPSSETNSGLRTHLLAEKLVEYKIQAPENDFVKKSLVEGLLINACIRFIQSGEKSRAIALVKSNYFPGDKLWVKNLLRLLLVFPKPLVNGILGMRGIFRKK